LTRPLSDLVFFEALSASKKARQLCRGAGAMTVKTWDDACLAFSGKGKRAGKGEIG
jgi:hypothetical protein